MRKAPAIGITILLIILIFGVLLAYSYTQLSVTLDDVRFHSIDWASLSWSTLLKLGLSTLTGNWLGAAFELIDGVNLNFIFGLTNNGLLPVYIPDLSYDILINDVNMGRGHSDVNITINPGQTQQITTFQNIKKDSLSPAVYSIVSTKGILDIKVKGTAYFQFFGLSVPIPFESSKQISIYDEIKNKLNSQIQKNKQEQKNSVISTVGKSLSSAINSIANELFGSKDLNLSLKGQTIVDSTFKISPGTYRSVYFTLSCTANVQGGFIASAVLGDDIVVYILDESAFNQYESGQNTSTYYNSNKVESGVFDVTLSPGKYHIVMSNTYSTFSTKTVQLQAATSCI